MFLARACLIALLACAPPPASGQPEGVEVVKVAEGVYAAVRKEPPGLMFNSNTVFIVNEEDVVVVDTNISPASAREVIAALRRLTTKPVRYVVNTHWHDDHIAGNEVYREAFPGVEFIGHASTLADLPTVGASNRKATLEGGPGFVAQIRELMGQNKSLTGGALTGEERASYLSDIRMAERYFAEAPKFQIVMPTLTVERRLTLHRGRRVIDIRHLGRGHSGADLVVHLPAESVVISGDLVVWPVPLVGSTSFPSEYRASLEEMLALRPAVIVPGHGQVLRGDAYARDLVRLLASIGEQTAAAVARGETLEQARRSVNLEEFRKQFAGDSQLRSFIFRFYVAGPGVAAAYREATAKK
ncbi:MAG TPA: MBL fold metallo-hydrolase [Pyrinomonadaceae bacterium]|nr:MBL fold metallo-hydrolase [Pyrinomonadaceae bacterium]